jgi:hypothetical protein
LKENINSTFCAYFEEGRDAGAAIRGFCESAHSEGVSFL